MLQDPSLRPWHSLIRSHGLNASIGLPLNLGSTTRIALFVYASEVDAFNDAERDHLERLAENLAFGVRTLRQQAALRESELNHRTLLEQAADVIVVTSPDGQLVFGNRAASELTGYSQQELLKLSIQDTYPVGEAEIGRKRLAEDPKATVVRFERMFRKKDNSCVPVEVAIARLENGNFQAFIRDISERRRSEKLLRDSETRFRQAIVDAPIPIILHAEDGEVLGISRVWTTLTGYAAKEIDTIDKWCALAYPDMEYRQRAICGIQKLFDLEHPVEEKGAFNIHTDDGRNLIWKFYTSRLDNLPDGRRVVISMAIDLTEQKKSEETLRKLFQAVEQTPTSILITDTDAVIEYVNPTFCKVTGYTREEVIGLNPSLLNSGKNDPSVHENLWKTITSGQNWTGEFRNRKKDGTLYWEHAVISPIKDETGCITHYLGVSEDITGKRQLEERFLRAQRLESIGTLASGIAHDLNNLLTPIIMTADMLREECAANADALSLIDTMERSAQRGADVVKQVLTFARGVSGERILLQPRHLVEDMIKIVRETFPRDIRIAQCIGKEIDTVTGDPTQLHQVLMNLSLNARDAMPQGGTLTYLVENVDLDEIYVANHPQSRPGRFIRIGVSDTGCGMSREVLDKCFEPFFTTKELGKGTGLGLPTSVGIVRSHEGFIEVDSEPGRGSHFYVFLPSTVLESTVKQSEPGAIQKWKGNGELILLVDDEQNIRNIVATTLGRSGYKVIEAADGAEGISLFHQNSDRIRAVVTDIMMPVMDGIALVRTLRQTHQNLPVIAATGLNTDNIEANLHALGVRHIISKPYSREELLQTLHEVLHTGAD